MARQPVSRTGSERPVRRELLDVLSLLLPSGQETELLRACLWSGDAGRSAWARFGQQVADPVAFFRHDPKGLSKLAPVLLRALEEYRGQAGSPLLTALRTARLREELRAAEYLRIAGSVGETLELAQVSFLVLGGAALGPTVYGDAALRHSHDIDLLVARAERNRAADALRASGFAGITRELPAEAPRELVHPSGLPVLLHDTLFGASLHPDRGESLWQDARSVRWGNRAVRVLSPADGLLHVLGKATMSPRRRSLTWVADSFFLLTRGPAPEWQVLRDGAERAGLTLPLFALLRYLSDALSAPVPGSALQDLEEGCRRVSSLQRDVVLYRAREGRSIPATFAALRGRGWRTWAYWVRVLLLPSPEYVRWTGAVGHPALLPVQYLRRPASWLWHLVTARLRRAARPA